MTSTVTATATGTLAEVDVLRVGQAAETPTKVSASLHELLFEPQLIMVMLVPAQSAPNSDKAADSGLQEAWQNYGLSVLFVGIFPILPIAIELAIHKSITEESLAITAAVYSVTVAVASKNKFYFGLFLLASIAEAALYGSITNSPLAAHMTTWKLWDIPITSYSSGQSDNNIFFLIAMLMAFLSLLVERFSRHVRNREEFFEFVKARRGE